MTVRITLILFLLLLPEAGLAASDSRTVIYRGWIEQFKTEPRGPFEGVQWFCRDGSVLPPKEYACRGHGGGQQHGEWNYRAEAMRQDGYFVANLLAAIKPETFTGPEAELDAFKQILFERFLIRTDDGWVFRKARYYRGAVQVEQEQVAAKKIMSAILNDGVWMQPGRFLLLREAVRLLPLALEPQLGAEIRQAATDISEDDKEFFDLRVKIHSIPDAGDAERVRAYARDSGLEELQNAYSSLAEAIDALYAPQTTLDQLRHLADESWNRHFKREMAETIADLTDAKGAVEAVAVAAASALRFRNILLQENNYTVYNRLRFLRASLILEQEAFAQGSRLLQGSAGASRAMRLKWLRHLATAIHASGLLSERQWQAIRSELARLSSHNSLSLEEYHAGLRYLARITSWAQRSLEFHFDPVIMRWQGITELAQSYVPDRLRGSPLLPFTRILDSLLADAGRLGAVRHTVFGKVVASGLRGLNPGLKRGVLLAEPESGEALRPDGIYMLASTRQELTPVAGIISRGETSSVSHLQLLARNLAIPNLVVSDELYEAIKTHIGERIVVAISHQGVVAIEQESPKWDSVFGEQVQGEAVTIRADLSKLDLNDRTLKPLSTLRSRDSGRTVGPKAANLGELLHFYPDLVNPGVVIPFGVFRQHLEQPLYEGGPSVFAWMRGEYARLKQIADHNLRSRETSRMLARLRNWIENSDPGEAFRSRLRQMLEQTFGQEGSYGLFVRSDTNVEDLPGFSGAGLNLTVPNVVGFKAVIDAILRVWASPFSERSHAWRQSLMENPEHLYAAVLLMKSFASEKSGVMITADVDSGDRNWLSIAANEGIGGAVEGQAAEELRVERQRRGGVKLLAQASAPFFRQLNPEGGLEQQAASGRERLLSRSELEKLRSLAADVEHRFPLPRSESGRAVVADIEFGFSRGELALFQIRPFVESQWAKNSRTLIEMDRDMVDRGERLVRMDRPPLVTEQL